jgi:hypothetical protein
MKLSDLTVEEFELAIEWIVRDVLAQSLEQGDVFKMSDEVGRTERPAMLEGKAIPASASPGDLELREESAGYQAAGRAVDLSMAAMEAVVRGAVQWTLGELVYEDELKLNPEFVKELEERLKERGESVPLEDVARELRIER